MSSRSSMGSSIMISTGTSMTPESEADTVEAASSARRSDSGRGRERLGAAIRGGGGGGRGGGPAGYGDMVTTEEERPEIKLGPTKRRSLGDVATLWPSSANDSERMRTPARLYRK